MKKYVICKACGYVMEEKNLKDRCPACGVDRKAFEPWQSRVSEARENLLKLDIHPVMVHFPQAFCYSIPIFMLLGLLSAPLKEPLFNAARVLAVGLPLAVIGSILTGILDGVTRFKKLTSLSLTRKLVLAATLFISSGLLSWLVLVSGFGRLPLVLGLLALSMACSAMLGLIGSRIATAKLPG